MSGSSVKTDNSLLSSIDQSVFKFESYLNFIGGVVILILILMTTVNILSRKLIGASIDGYIDYVLQFMVIFAFIGVSYCHRLGGHIRMDILIGQLRGRMLWFAEILNTILMMIVIAALTYGSYFHFLRSTQGTLVDNLYILITQGFFEFMSATSGDSSGQINLPLWPAKLLVPFSFSILFIRLALHLWGYTRAFINNDPEPVAVPLIEDAATQALHEAESIESAGNSIGEKTS